MLTIEGTLWFTLSLCGAREFAFDALAYASTVETVVRRVRRAAPSALILLTAPSDQERATAGGFLPIAALARVMGRTPTPPWWCVARWRSPA